MEKILTLNLSILVLKSEQLGMDLVTATLQAWTISGKNFWRRRRSRC